MPPGARCTHLIAELYPICRSITGDGVRRTLEVLARGLELTRKEVPTGTRVFDWIVPKEWNVTDAWVANAAGERLIDFRRSNLHVLQYSIPIRRRVTRAELAAHLHTLPDHPRWIPYRTSYYEERWGFCIEHDRLKQLNEEEYDVCIDSTLADGHLTYGEYVIPGASEEEFLFSCHVCHPSLCNDNLSGIALTAQLARLSERRRAALFLPVPVSSRNHRGDHLAQPQRGSSAANPPRPRRRLRRRRRAVHATSAAAAATPAIDRAVEHVLRAVRGRFRDPSTSRRTATTSGSTALPASTFRSAA